MSNTITTETTLLSLPNYIRLFLLPNVFHAFSYCVPVTPFTFCVLALSTQPSPISPFSSFHCIYLFLTLSPSASAILPSGIVSCFLTVLAFSPVLPSLIAFLFWGGGGGWRLLGLSSLSPLTSSSSRLPASAPGGEL